MQFDLKYALITNYLLYVILILYPVIQLFGTNDLINLIILIAVTTGVEVIISKSFGQQFFKQHPEYDRTNRTFTLAANLCLIIGAVILLVLVSFSLLQNGELFFLVFTIMMILVEGFKAPMKKERNA
ncbi:hypothetical protein [Lentilactobacillus kisonensis]|uniref:Uncharacterized protein n=2 Tax=Lentilactobacillus kisonensis TaxID=481722 RepID=H1LHT2_9LACO|nr:hypothetical protein [Lentilactobacillus kisonensis]EHO50216.1 hypothetical protein HMPREF9104_02173 [Lentilactobacillus kisonensis F0435]KRL20816.1 hypothetical protein FC98_GL001221 [Lentilactobacillus kisonensis DSM 19906 = JCM 15041]